MKSAPLLLSLNLILNKNLMENFTKFNKKEKKGLVGGFFLCTKMGQNLASGKKYVSSTSCIQINFRTLVCFWAGANIYFRKKISA